MSKSFEPHFKTPLDLHSKEEVNKRHSQGMNGTLFDEYRDVSATDVSWEAEQLSKSYGIYLEFDRAKTGKEKDWMYMIRIGLPGGGPITPSQWATLHDLASQYARTPEGEAAIRLTTRANIQFHWVKKEHLIPLIRTAAESGLLSLNGCGDNVRSVLSCPLAHTSDVFNPGLLAQKATNYFRLPAQPFLKIFAVDPAAVDESEEQFSYGPQLLNRKFKIAFTTVYRDKETGLLLPDNCVEMRTHDLGVAPVIDGDRLTGKYQIYVGGGQGEKVGKPTSSMLAQPLGIVSEAQLWPTLDAVVAVHQEWGDRENRHWARLKYVIKKLGVEWYRDRVAERTGFELGEPDLNFDEGPRHLHHGWTEAADGTYAFGAYIECGRLKDGARGGDLLAMTRHLTEKYQSSVMITPNQDIIFTGIPASLRQRFEEDMAAFGYGTLAGRPITDLRRASGACVGRDTCRLAYTDSEKFEPVLLDQLEDLGWGDVATSIGITGCERQCFRPATKAFGLIGSGSDRYQLKLFGTEDCRNQGQHLVHDGSVFLKSVPRERVAPLIHSLLGFWKKEAREGETPGYFFRRKGLEEILEHLQQDPATVDLLDKPLKNAVLLV